MSEMLTQILHSSILMESGPASRIHPSHKHPHASRKLSPGELQEQVGFIYG